MNYYFRTKFCSVKTYVKTFLLTKFLLCPLHRVTNYVYNTYFRNDFTAIDKSENINTLVVW